jgi:hypothetical protein
MLSEATVYSLSIAGLGFFGLVVRYCFRSKCSEVSCCFGLLKIERDIEHEVAEEQIEATNQKIYRQNSNIEEAKASV